MDLGTWRARKAMVRMGVALVIAVAVGVAYLRPSLTPAAPARPLSPALGSVQVAGASFADADHGSVTISRGSVGLYTFLTSDGGRSWRPFDQSALYVGAGITLAWPLGQPASTGPRVSRDGGRTWRPFPMPAVNETSTGLPDFLDADHAWLLMRPRLGAPQPPPPATLWRTDDGGATWRHLAGTGLTGVVAGSPVFVDALHGVLIVLGPSGTREVLATGDGGETWRPVLGLASPWPASNVANAWAFAIGGGIVLWLASEPLGVIVDGRHTVRVATVASQDGGATWGGPTAGPDLVARFADPPVADAAGRLILLEGRRLWTSGDGGASWTPRLIQAPGDVEPEVLVSAAAGALYATASLIGGTAAGRYAVLLRSVDGGAHWDRVRLPTGAGIDAQAVDVRPNRRVSGHR